MSKSVFAFIAAPLAFVTIAAGFATPVLAQTLPAGAGKELVETVCTGCHDLEPVTGGPGFTKADWDLVLKSMIDMGASIKADQAETIATYLATAFPPKK